MSNYTKTTDFAAKDALTSGDPEKVATGTDVDVEFNAISTAIATKEDTANKGAANGYAGLGSGGLLDDSDLSTNVPLKNASNVFTGAVQTISANTPVFSLHEADAASNEKYWKKYASGGALFFIVQADDQTGDVIWAQIDRTGTVIDSIALSSTAFTWGGSNVGFRELPQNSQTANYTLVAADNGKHVLHASGGGASDTFTIPANASVAYPIGTVLTFVNRDSNAVTIAITTDTMYFVGTTSTGSRSLAQNGIATAIKVESTVWIISGTGLT